MHDPAAAASWVAGIIGMYLYARSLKVCAFFFVMVMEIEHKAFLMRGKCWHYWATSLALPNSFNYSNK